MALAQRLNELAASHSQGLLDDDEYRLLRQDVFERFSDTTIIPIEAHVIPIEHQVVPMSVHIDEATAQSSIRIKKQVEFVPSSPPRSKIIPSNDSSFSARSKPNSVTLGVASLIRRATGRKPSSKDSSVISSTPINLKRVFIPQIISRKSSSDISIHSGSSGTHNDAISLSSRKTSLSSGPFSPPLSPTSATQSRKDPSSTHSLKVEVSAPVMGDDIFEDGGLNTTKDIRQAITELEEEGRRVIDAFNDLERSTIGKVYKGRPTSPIAETIKSEWYWIQASTSSALQIQSKGSSSSLTSHANSTHSVPDPGIKQRAATISRSASVSVPKRKGSMSSLTTTSTSFLTVSKPNPTISRSTGHLPLTAIAEQYGASRASSDAMSSRSPSVSDVGDTEVDSEVMEVRRRRQEVIGRYEARLEYLRARLKGAELHERLLKR
ncbi:hypothetical protein VNI00_005038 [Paramarasmius palmivorus]|uniref:Uncharacterized protein n=1 Tax=Paramarasmius palmivorus TaxID=297713 RepID=A0AAW0DK42_9AGAR